jgi:two-component system cell cycle response regulator DivK
MPPPVILVVEDHQETRQVYAELLGGSYTVLQAGDGPAALAVMQEHRPSLVITDFSLPGIDGFELIRRIRSTPATQNLPTICLSGYGGRAHEARAREVGCDRVLEKPCPPDLLLRIAEEVLRNRRGAD